MQDLRSAHCPALKKSEHSTRVYLEKKFDKAQSQLNRDILFSFHTSRENQLKREVRELQEALEILKREPDERLRHYMTETAKVADLHAMLAIYQGL